MVEERARIRSKTVVSLIVLISAKFERSLSTPSNVVRCMTTYQQGVGQLDPGMDCVKAAPSASHLCAVNPDGAEHLTRPDLQPVVAFLFARVKGLDLNDCKNACIQGSPDLVLQATDCEVVEHRAQKRVSGCA